MDDRLHILRWFEFASDDLDSAKILVKYGLRKANAVCYHSQQSAEKNLKGYLLASGLEEPPHIHNLPALAALCEDYGVSFSEIIAPCSRLNPYGVRVKYPDEIDIDERNAAQAISDAETVASFAPIAEMRKALETEHRKEYDIAEIARIAGVTDESRKNQVSENPSVLARLDEAVRESEASNAAKRPPVKGKNEQGL